MFKIFSLMILVFGRDIGRLELDHSPVSRENLSEDEKTIFDAPVTF